MIEDAYTLITFSLGMTVASAVVLIDNNIINITGKSLYPFMDIAYNSLKSQISANETEVQTMLYNSYKNSLYNIQQTVALSTLVTVLQIMVFIVTFIILLGLLMNIAFAPRPSYARGGV